MPIMLRTKTLKNVTGWGDSRVNNERELPDRSRRA